MNRGAEWSIGSIPELLPTTTSIGMFRENAFSLKRDLVQDHLGYVQSGWRLLELRSNTFRMNQVEMAIIYFLNARANLTLRICLQHSEIESFTVWGDRPNKKPIQGSCLLLFKRKQRYKN